MKNRTIRKIEFSYIVRCILLIVFMCVPSTIDAGLMLGMSSAKEANTSQNHYIIAFDLSVGIYRSDCNSKNTLSSLESHLKKKGYKSGKDYISILGYNLDLENPDEDSIARLFRDPSDKPILWRRLGKNTISSLFPDWPKGKPENAPHFYASMQSLAKPYLVMGANNNLGNTADRTFLVLVTDEVVNGADDDYQKEFQNVLSSPGANIPELRKIKDKVIKTARSFNELFSFIQDDDKTLVARHYYGGEYNIIQYEVIPNQLPSINSVSNFPSLLPLKKVKGGFRLNVNVSSVNKYYKISYIQINNGRGQLLCETDSGEFNNIISSQKIKEGDTLNVSMELIYEDGMYNGMRLSNRNARFRKGLTVEQVVTIPDEAKIMGIMPLTDSLWWFYYDNAAAAVVTWDVILLILFIIFICISAFRMFKRITRYVPDNQVISISKK